MARSGHPVTHSRSGSFLGEAEPDVGLCGLVPAGALNDPHHRVHRVARLCNRGTAHAGHADFPLGETCSLIVTRARPRRCSPADLGSAETTNRRESLCLNAYLMNHWSRSSIRVCLAGVASTAGCRAEMTTSSRWRPSVTEWPQVWRITRRTTCRPRQTLRRQEFPKQSIWLSEGCWATPQSTRRTADSASSCGHARQSGSRGRGSTGSTS